MSNLVSMQVARKRKSYATVGRKVETKIMIRNRIGQKIKIITRVVVVVGNGLAVADIDVVDLVE